MKQLKKLFFAFAIIIISSCTLYSQGTPNLHTGNWNGELLRNDSQKIHFNFQLEKAASTYLIQIISSENTLNVDEIRQQDDSLIIKLPYFDSEIRARIINSKLLEGKYIKHFADSSTSMVFKAVSTRPRAMMTDEPAVNITGTWELDFSYGKNRMPAVGEFLHERNGKVSGSILTPYGDYRFLEGNLIGENLTLNVFDGGFAAVFKAKVKADKTMTDGKMYNGAYITESFTGKYNPDANLPDSFFNTQVLPGKSGFGFKFKDTDGNLVSLTDARYKNKVVVVQVLGSWCPNCLDETAFLNEYYKANKHKGIEIVALAYERTADYDRSVKALMPFRTRLKVEYPFLVTGVAASDPYRTEKTIPEINKLAVFPTTFFVDKKGNIAKIHTGYNGPATGKHYEQFKKEFEATVNSLLSQ
ncbi:peroxiredoxin family protein [Polluticaenibacter yanchengensis]|uniref:peroxiredoxin family protein n=1 Tax=Polluticaenibacter yanchengensis TaxID=3014562 RepID=UPI00387AE48E